MKRLFALVLALCLAFAFSGSALAAVTPPGYRRLSDADLEKICSSLNKNNNETVFEYDKNLPAIVISTLHSEKTDSEKGIINLINKAERGDESAKSSVSLWATLYQKQAESYFSTMLDQGFYVDVVFRCLDPMENDAVALEYINGIRTSFRPELHDAEATEASVPVVSTDPVITDIGLEGKSYDELVALKDQINKAIWDSAEWQEVEVPQGVWEVGADIPAGKWTILPGASGNTFVKVGTEIKDGGTDVSSKASASVRNDTYKYYKAESDLTSWTYEFTAGEYVKIEFGSAIFTPYAGKPSLGFK